MPDALWHYSGYAVAALAAALVLWALFADRARGRKRCRKCWYDLAPLGEPPTTCPEGGTAHTKPKHLTRTRRRKRLAALGLFVMIIGGYGLWTTPRVIERGWYGAVPTAVLILALPWLPRDIPQLSLNSGPHSKSAQRDAHIMALGGETFRIMMKQPDCLADEAAIRWNEMGTLLRRGIIEYWWKTGQLERLSESPQPRFGNTTWTPAILVFEAFVDERQEIPQEVSNKTIRGIILSEQPAIWSNSTEPHYEIDPVQVIRQTHHWLPSEISIKVTLHSESPSPQTATLDIWELKSQGSRSWASSTKSQVCFPVHNVESSVKVFYQITRVGELSPTRFEIEYELVPWLFEPEEARISWGVAVPRFINGEAVEPRQEPTRSLISHLIEARSERQDPP